MNGKRKVKEIVQGNVCAEIYEKRRERDSKCFYDTVYRRVWHDDSQNQHKADYLQLKDQDDVILAAIAVKRFINHRLWETKNHERLGIDDAGWNELPD